jgi:peptidoglycan-associated lipoprotein
MTKKIILISSVFFLSSCSTSVSELGDKFLDLINPSDDAVEVADLTEAQLIAEGSSSIFSEEDLRKLSNTDLIQIAEATGFADLVKLDENGNLANREELIQALLDAGLTKGETLTKSELEKLSDSELINKAIESGNADLIVLGDDGNLANREELIEALAQAGVAKDESSGQSSANQEAIDTLKSSGVESVLYFAYDDTEIDEEATRVIIQHANFMQNNPSVNLRLEGHADERGTREYNLALGENRALSVEEVLGLYNLEDRIEVISFGEESPVAFTHDESAWKLNRRVEFVYY